MERGVVLLDRRAVGVAVARAGGLEHGAVRTGGAHDVLGVRRVQQRYRQRVNSPERVREVAEEVVGQGVQEHGVETVVLLGEGLARGGEPLHLPDDGVDRGVPAPLPDPDHLLGEGVVQGGAHLDDLAQGLVVVPGLEQAAEDERLHHGAHRYLADEHPVPVAHLDDVERHQRADGLADGRAGHAQIGAQL